MGAGFGASARGRRMGGLPVAPRHVGAVPHGGTRPPLPLRFDPGGIHPARPASVWHSSWSSGVACACMYVAPSNNAYTRAHLHHICQHLPSNGMPRSGTATYCPAGRPPPDSTGPQWARCQPRVWPPSNRTRVLLDTCCMLVVTSCRPRPCPCTTAATSRPGQPTRPPPLTCEPRVHSTALGWSMAVACMGHTQSRAAAWSTTHATEVGRSELRPRGRRPQCPGGRPVAGSGAAFRSTALEGMSGPAGPIFLQELLG